VEALSYQEVLAFAQSWGAVYFLSMFVVVLVYVFWPSNRKEFNEAAAIPLHDGDEP